MKSLTHPATIRLVIVSVVTLFIIIANSPPPALAATITADQDGDWNDPATWDGGAVPTSSDVVIIPAGVTVAIPGSLFVDRNADTIIEASATLINNGMLTNDGTLDNNGTITNNGTLTITNFGTLTITVSGTLDNFGILDTVDGTLRNNGTLDNNGTLLNDFNGRLFNGGFGTLTNNGMLHNIGMLLNFGIITSNGTIDNTGPLTTLGTFTNDGTLTNKDLAILDNQNTITNNNIVLNECGGTLRGNTFTDPPVLNNCITVTPTSDLITTEAGGMTDFTVSLDVAPDTGTQVVLDIASLTPTEGTVSPTQLVFTDTNTPQIVTITGVDDGVMDGDQPYTVQVTFNSSDDERFSATNILLDAIDVSVTNQADDNNNGDPPDHASEPGPPPHARGSGPPPHAQNDEQGPPDHASEPGPPPHAQNDEKGPPDHSDAGGRGH